MVRVYGDDSAATMSVTEEEADTPGTHDLETCFLNASSNEFTAGDSRSRLTAP
jgi:hypothetical protein